MEEPNHDDWVEIQHSSDDEKNTSNDVTQVNESLLMQITGSDVITCDSLYNKNVPIDASINNSNNTTESNELSTEDMIDAESDDNCSVIIHDSEDIVDSNTDSDNQSVIIHESSDESNSDFEENFENDSDSTNVTDSDSDSDSTNVTDSSDSDSTNVTDSSDSDSTNVTDTSSDYDDMPELIPITIDIDDMPELAPMLLNNLESLIQQHQCNDETCNVCPDLNTDTTPVNQEHEIRDNQSNPELSDDLKFCLMLIFEYICAILMLTVVLSLISTVSQSNTYSSYYDNNIIRIVYREINTGTNIYYYQRV
jgi:hypothetical protein